MSATPTDNLLRTGLDILARLRHRRFFHRFQRRVGYLPRVAAPTRFGEKMLWRKLFDRNPSFLIFCDKLATRDFQRSRCPDLALPETLWVGTDPAGIPREVLSSLVVVKASHGWGQNIFPPPGIRPEGLDGGRLRGWLRHTHGSPLLEWGYQGGTPRLLIERRVTGLDGAPPLDLSVHAVSGRAVLLEAVVANKTDRQQKAYFAPSGRRWRAMERSDEEPGGRLLPLDFELPSEFHQAIAFTRRLGADLDYGRFDFLSADGRLHGGEITVYPGSGLGCETVFRSYNRRMSQEWNLRDSWFLRTPQTGWRRHYARRLREWLEAGDRDT